MITASRTCTTSHAVPRPRGDGAAFVEAVQRAVTEGRYGTVLGGGDDWLAALATYRASLPVAVAAPPWPTVEAALDKLGLIQQAAEAGIAAPVTVVADDVAVASWVGPVVVKCRSHWFPGLDRAHRIEARWFATPRMAAGRIRMIREAGFEPLLQQPIDGRLGALIGLFHDGRLRGRVQQVSPRLWPTPNGVSSRAMTVPVDEGLVSRCEALLTTLGWRGLVELQFLTPAGGAPHLIDLNGRFYGSMALAIAAGPNLPDAWARQTLGMPLPPLPDGRRGLRFSWTAGDLRRALTERRGGLAADVASTLAWRWGATTGLWDVHDTGPVVDLARSRWHPMTPMRRNSG